MKKILLNPKLTKIENATTLYFIICPIIYMILQLGEATYYPLLLLGKEYGEVLNLKMYEPITWAMMKGTAILILANIFTAFVALRYRKTQETRLTKKFVITLFVLGLIEFYYRALAYIFEAIPGGEWFFEEVTPGVLWRTIFQGIIFILFAVSVWKRSNSDVSDQSARRKTDDIEAQLLELNSLKEKNLITEAEYSAKRSKLIS